MEQLAPSDSVKFRDLAATVQSVRASAAGILTSFIIVNNQAAVVFIQIFDVATAGGVTLATTNPDLEVSVAANATLPVNLSASGWKFRTGLQIASTTTEKGLTGSAAGVQVFFQIQ